MPNVIFNREITDAIGVICYELKRMNDLREKEIELKEKELELAYGHDYRWKSR